MNRVFLDTVGMLAIWDEDDQSHPAAIEAFSRLQKARSKVLTTSHVMAECGNAASRTTFRNDVVELREQLELDEALVFPTHDDWRSAWEGYRLGHAAQAGIVDHLSFFVMKRLGISEVFTNDRHFLAAGFRTLF